MTTAPKGKPYIIGSVKASTAKIALKRARDKYPGSNPSVKMYAKGSGREMSIYNVYSKRGRTIGPRKISYRR